MLEEMFDNVCKKVVKKSSSTVKAEVNQEVKRIKKDVKEKIDKATSGENGKKLLIAAVGLSVVALLTSLIGARRQVVVNVYNN